MTPIRGDPEFDSVLESVLVRLPAEEVRRLGTAFQNLGRSEAMHVALTAGLSSEEKVAQLRVAAEFFWLGHAIGRWADSQFANA